MTRLSLTTAVCHSGDILARSFLLRKKRGPGLIKGEEKFEAGAFGVEWGGAIGAIYGAVERGVGFGKAEGHGDGIVKVGKNGAAGLVFGAHRVF